MLISDLNRSLFSVIIATWKRDDLLKDCLDSLQAVYDELPEIIVVDNANLDSTRKLVSAYQNVRYVSAPGNLGFAGGNNLGMRYCEREYVILLNNDTIFKEDSISPLLRFMDEHPNVALAQGRTVYADDPNVVDGCGLTFSSIGLVELVGDRGQVGESYDVTRPMPAGGGAFCAFRRSALSVVGGSLYHDFFWAYFEDVDLSIRVWRAGYEFWYVSSPPVLHRKNLTAKMFPSEKILGHFYFNMTASYFVNFGLFGWLRFFAVRVTCYFVKAIWLLFLIRPGYAMIHLRVLRRLWQDRKTLSSIRARLSTCRKLSDHETLRKFHDLRLNVHNA